jgi:hypothetical protein
MIAMFACVLVMAGISVHLLVKYGRLQDATNALLARNLMLAHAEVREMALKRALEDLAFAEIDRARFALEVVYAPKN